MLRFLIGSYVSILLLLLNTSAWAIPGEGSCLNYKFPPKQLANDGTISTILLIRVLQEGAKVYTTAESKELIRTLKFNTAVLPRKIKGMRIAISKNGSDEILGWVESADLLCGHHPLTSKGLERKAFIKTPPSEEIDGKTVTAYPSPYAKDCNIGRCQQLSRFTLLYIMAEDVASHRFLLADHHNLAAPDLPPLLGWVDFDRTIPWNTTVGLRPKENTDLLCAYEDFNDSKFKSRKDCLKDKVQAIKNGKKIIVLKGGNVWYKNPMHIPVLDNETKDNIYKVAAPSVGMQGFRPFKADKSIDPFRYVDVFFVLDGTATMKPYIEAAKKAVHKIAKGLRKEADYVKSSFRFGFQVYRDDYADDIPGMECNKGVCEYMKLSASTCHANKLDTKKNWKEFKQQIDKVKVTVNDKDDYPERLFNGLRQTIGNIESCNERAKLIFVIGDHGDRQSEDPWDIYRDLKSGPNGNFNRVALYFIQTPNNSSIVKNPKAYTKAYTAFKNQAYKIVDHVLPKKLINKGKETYINRNEFIFELDAYDLVETVLNHVATYSDSSTVDESKQSLRAGNSLENIIHQGLEGDEKTVLYWQWMKDAACGELEEQCEKRIVHDVIDFYIPENKEIIQEEVWMKSKNLIKWLEILKPFGENDNGDIDFFSWSPTKQKKKFADILVAQIESVLGEPKLKLNIALGKQLMKRISGFPMREQGPLLQYSLHELRTMEACEMRYLADWLKSVRNILVTVAAEPRMKVSFELEDYKEPSCYLSDKGKNIKKMVLNPPSFLGDGNEYSYLHSLYGEQIYWLPIDFLP
ncbi:hypothetical protein QUF61_17600 [Candidatus Venteria ishoeyi]|uniref:hypothetical protein n=1 Tax=Candidatus Venteria ishoeyi TaxID=1899563 RepID=UPI0025A62506|nr:hypothetical protein [Candidatus Venteria ishoeyi]MDM8548309.1 hypothetical protein [Candidatus Venteria ishoeyi]